MNRSVRGTMAGIAMATASLAQPVSADGLRRIPHPDNAGVSLAVRAPDAPLVFTEHVFPRNTAGDAGSQANDLLAEIARVLTAAGSSPHDILRLNAHVATDAALPAIERAIAQRLGATPPAVTLARSPLSMAGALVAADVVALSSRATKSVSFSPGVAIMPAGGKVFVAGQAKRASGLAAGVAQTMEALHASVAHLGRAKADIVHVKAFITPFAEHATARAEIAKSFGRGPIPPIVIIEWLSETPAEIELAVAHPELTAKGGEALAYLPLPGLPTSPVFSRVTTVAAGTPLIFIAGIDGGERGDARVQWQHVFGQLAVALRDTGSSFRHMVKATYFLCDPQARAALGEIRGVYYDPARPPSASALDVQTLGRPGRRVMLDMIAAPAKSESPK